MKKVLFTFLLLSGCVLPQRVETGLSACPSAGLSGLAFYEGVPSNGRIIAPERVEGGSRWDFGATGGNTYVVCSYEGHETTQRFPSGITSCEASSDLASVRCQGKI